MVRKKSHFQDKEPMLEKMLFFWRFKRIANCIPPKSNVLDLGCGYKGKLLSKISEIISSGTGLDLSVDPDHSHSKIRLLIHNLNNPFPFSGDNFDVIISLANLEHLDEPLAVFREIHRVLKPGGILLLTAPSKLGKPVLEFLSLFGLVSRKEIKDHKNYFGKKILTEYGRNAGFSSARHKYFQFGMNNFLIAKK